MQGWPIFVILLQCSVLHSIFAGEVLRYASCWDRDTVPNFDIERFTNGTWYEQKVLEKPDCKCKTVNYILLPDNKLTLSIYGNCDETDEYGSGTWDFEMSLSSLPGKFVPDSDDSDYTYYIVKTDYEKYAVYWACAPPLDGSQSRVYVAGLTRDRYPDQSVLNDLEKIISEYRIRGYETIFQVDQVNC